MTAWVEDCRQERCVQCGVVFTTTAKRYRAYDLCPKCTRLLVKLRIDVREWVAEFRREIRPLTYEGQLPYRVDDWGFFAVVVAALAQAARDGQDAWLRETGAAWLEAFDLPACWIEKFIASHGDLDLRMLRRIEGGRLTDNECEDIDG